MDLLLDTHVLLWWESATTLLPTPVRDAIKDPDRRIFVSAATFWEVAIKVRAGKLDFQGSLRRAAAASGFEELPISASDAERAGGFSFAHRDPFDRMLVAQCQNHSLTLATADMAIRRLGLIDVLWAR